MTFDENKSCLAKEAGTRRCCSAILLLLGLGTASYLSAWSPPPARPDARDIRPVHVTVANLTTPAPGERPNVLWLIAEDTLKTNFGVYGNTYVKTPNIDRLATLGIRFNNASSTAPHCSPARATLISGTHATVYGTDIHRMPVPVPTGQHFFPKLLRQAGYYTTNNSKTDYNVKPVGAALVEAWSAQGGTATYKNAAGASVLLCVHKYGAAHGPSHEVPAQQAHGTAYRSEQRSAAAVRPGFASLA